MSRPSDREEERALDVVRASRLVKALERLIVIVQAAWRGSLVRRTAVELGGGPGESLSDRVGLAGGVIGVAAATALVLQRFASRPEGPTWIVPAAALIAGIALLGLARVKSERQS